LISSVNLYYQGSRNNAALIVNLTAMLPIEAKAHDDENIEEEILSIPSSSPLPLYVPQRRIHKHDFFVPSLQEFSAISLHESTSGHRLFEPIHYTEIIPLNF
jgi:hypothetical protein